MLVLWGTRLGLSMLALGWYFGPISPLCWPMLTLWEPMLVLWGPRLGLSMLALGWVYLCCHSGLSTLYWPHLPLMLAYVGPMSVNPILAPSPPYVGLCWPYGSLGEPILALSPPYVGPCWPYDSLCWCYLAPRLNLCSRMLAFEMLTPIAVTEKAEVGRGWGGGGEGVTTGWRRGDDGWVGGWGGTPL